VVIGNRIHAAELAQVIFVRCVVPVPRHHIKRRVSEGASEQLSAELVDEGVVSFHVFKGRNGGEEVSWVGQAIGTEGSQVRENKVARVHLQDLIDDM
jgi:hypothetical protein